MANFLALTYKIIYKGIQESEEPVYLISLNVMERHFNNKYKRRI